MWGGGNRQEDSSEREEKGQYGSEMQSKNEIGKYIRDEMQRMYTHM